MNCVICAEEAEAADLHWLPCGHGFHTDCIVDWFRRGKKSCPLCRDEPAVPTSPADRERLLRQFARRRNVPSALVRCIRRVREVEAKKREMCRQRSMWRMRHQGVLSESHRLERRCVALHREYEAAREKLRKFVHPGVPVPLLHVSDDSDDSESE